MTLYDNMLGPDPTLLPERPQAQATLDEGADPVDVVKAYPDFSAAWAALAERALDDDEPVTAYAFARTGYHRGLDQLRRSGWKGFGPVPWNHVPNQGFLRAVAALARAARAIGEVAEYDRCRKLLADSDRQTVAVLGLD